MDGTGFRVEKEANKLNEVKVQVQAAEMLLREERQVSALIDMVTKQADVIKRLQAQLQVEDRVQSRYGVCESERKGEGKEEFRQKNYTTANMFRLDQLRYKVETELNALSTMNAELSSTLNGTPTAHNKKLAGPCESNCLNSTF